MRAFNFFNRPAWKQSHRTGGTKLTARQRGRLRDLLHQQLWCWGRDIVSPWGNLLIRYGMHRHARPSARAEGSHRYTAGLPNGAEIHLWGFGAVISHVQGAVFLQRYQTSGRLLRSAYALADCSRPEHLLIYARPAKTPSDKAEMGRLIGRFCRWAEAYERWIAVEAGQDYRDRILKAWEHPVMSGAEMPGAWHDLALLFRRQQIQSKPLLFQPKRLAI